MEKLHDINNKAKAHGGEHLGVDECGVVKWSRYFFNNHGDANRFLQDLTFACLGKAVTSKGNICSVLI